jgi:hypothetical protein
LDKPEGTDTYCWTVEEARALSNQCRSQHYHLFDDEARRRMARLESFDGAHGRSAADS